MQSNRIQYNSESLKANNDSELTKSAGESKFSAKYSRVMDTWFCI
jgi:hypothetical protein